MDSGAHHPSQGAPPLQVLPTVQSKLPPGLHPETCGIARSPTLSSAMPCLVTQPHPPQRRGQQSNPCCPSLASDQCQGPIIYLRRTVYLEALSCGPPTPLPLLCPSPRPDPASARRALIPTAVACVAADPWSGEAIRHGLLRMFLIRHTTSFPPPKAPPENPVKGRHARAERGIVPSTAEGPLIHGGGW